MLIRVNVISTFFSYRRSYYPIIYVWLGIDVIPTLFPLHVLVLSSKEPM